MPNPATAGHPEKLLTRVEVAAIMRVSPRTVLNWAKQGILHPVILPGHARARGYRARELRQLLR